MMSAKMGKTKLLAIIAVAIVVVAGVFIASRQPSLQPVETVTPTKAVTEAPQAIVQAEVASAVRASEVYWLPMVAAEEYGFWKKNGLQVAWKPFGGGGPMFQAVAAGQVSVGLASVGAILDARARGIPVKIIGVYTVGSGYDFLVLNDSPLKKVEDLKDKKVGVIATGGDTYFMTIFVKKYYNIDFEVIGTGPPPPSIAALKTGKIDAYIWTGATLQSLIDANELRSVLRLTTILPRPWPDFAMFATEDYIKKNPDTVKKIAAAFFATIDFLQKNPGEALKVQVKESKFSEASSKKVVDSLTWNPKGRVEASGIANVLAYYVGGGLIPAAKAPPVDDTYDWNYV